MIVSPVARGHHGPMARRRIHDDELHAQFVTFSCCRRRRSLDHPRARRIVMGVLAAQLKKHDGTCCGFFVYTEKKALEKLDDMHKNPVTAGLVEQACDWPWSSARYHEQGKSVGVPLGWVF